MPKCLLIFILLMLFLLTISLLGERGPYFAYGPPKHPSVKIVQINGRKGLGDDGKIYIISPRGRIDLLDPTYDYHENYPWKKQK